MSQLTTIKVQKETNSAEKRHHAIQNKNKTTQAIELNFRLYFKITIRQGDFILYKKKQILKNRLRHLAIQNINKTRQAFKTVNFQLYFCFIHIWIARLQNLFLYFLKFPAVCGFLITYRPIASLVIGGGHIFIYSCSQTIKTIDFKRN